MKPLEGRTYLVCFTLQSSRLLTLQRVLQISLPLEEDFVQHAYRRNSYCTPSPSGRSVGYALWGRTQ